MRHVRGWMCDVRDTTSGQRWAAVLLASFLLALVSLFTVIPSLRPEHDPAVVDFLRLTVSMLVNAGTVWAGLLVFAGWMVGKPCCAGVAALAAGYSSLVTHYAVGRILGVFPADIWVQKLHWFAAVTLLGPLLGIVGAWARRHTLAGRLCALVVPVGAVCEPLATGAFMLNPTWSWPMRYASVASGVLLLLAGVVGAVMVIRAGYASRRLERTPPPARVA